MAFMVNRKKTGNASIQAHRRESLTESDNGERIRPRAIVAGGEIPNYKDLCREIYSK
jgi:hypothetical protein